MKVSVRAASSKSLWDFTATTSHGHLQNHMAALFKHRPLVDSGRISHMETFRIIQQLCLKRCPLVDLGQVWNSLCISLWETHVEHTLQMNAPYLKDIRPTFVVHGLSPLQSKVSDDKMSEIITGHIKSMKISNVLMVTAYSSLLGRGITSIIIQEKSLNQMLISLFWVKRSTSSLMNWRSPISGRIATFHSVSKRAHGNNVPPSRHIDRVSHGTYCRW